MVKRALSFLLIATAWAGAALGQEPVSPSALPSYPTPASPTTGSDPSALNPSRPSSLSSNQADGSTGSAASVLGNGCGNGCCAECKTHGWLGVDYLMLFPSALNLPTILQNPNGGVLIGGQAGYGISNGARLNTGIWLCGEDKAMQTIAFATLRSYDTMTATTGLVTLRGGGEPFTIPVTNFIFQAWHQVAGGEGNTLLRLRGDDTTRLYGLAGVKYLNLEEDITMRYGFGTSSFLDQFHTKNQFMGGQVGAILTHRTDKLILDLTAKLALGNNFTQLFVLGRNSLGVPFQAFTGPSNIGYYETNYLSLVPELNVNAGYRVTNRITANIGYNFLFWINTWRPGDQISLATPPRVPFVESTYFLHGLNFGATLRY